MNLWRRFTYWLGFPDDAIDIEKEVRKLRKEIKHHESLGKRASKGLKQKFWEGGESVSEELTEE